MLGPDNTLVIDLNQTVKIYSDLEDAFRGMEYRLEGYEKDHYFFLKNFTGLFKPVSKEIPIEDKIKDTLIRLRNLAMRDRHPCQRSPVTVAHE